MKKKMNITEFFKKYSMDESFKTLRETAKASSGTQKATLQGRINKALKTSSASGIAKKEGNRYKLTLPDAETRKKLDDIMKFRRNLEAMRTKTNRMMSSQKNDAIALYLLDLDSLLSKGLNKANEIEKHLKQVSGLK